MNGKLMIWYFILVGSFCAAVKRGQVLKLYKIPSFRSLRPDISFAADEEEAAKAPTKTKLLVIRPRDQGNVGRFFNHILLRNNRPDYMLPYLIINNPFNLTNINNNSLNNVPPPAMAAAGAGAAGVRIAYIRDSQALPYSLPTQTYQQRQQLLPQLVYDIPPNSVNPNKRYPNRLSNGNQYQNPNRRKTNPFTMFANNLRRVQFL